ncbi:MAG TPA: pilus assembly protein TadG-related protein, partial [Negativicutes bacterium]
MKITGKQSQSGSILVFVTIACVAFIGFLGLAVDMGHLYMVKIKMQNAVDAAALAGAAKLPSESAAKQQAANFVQANAQVDARANGFYYDPSNATAAVTAFNDTRYPNAAYAITVTLTNNVPTYFLTVFGVRNFPLTVTAEAIASAGSGG